MKKDNFKVSDHEYSNVELRDIAKEVKFNKSDEQLYAEADVCIICYDITKQDSFNSLGKWIKSYKDNGPKLTSIIVVGTKLDQKN